MKKLVLKTAFITLAVTVVLALSVYGILSSFTPALMMRITDALGLEGASGDYAYAEYERSGDVDYLARAFEYAAANGKDKKAEERFALLYAHEGFSALCEKRDAETGEEIGYRAYICGQAACVRYRLADTDEKKAEVITFAVSETAHTFPSGNPVIALSVEAARAEDKAFCALLLGSIEGQFEDNINYRSIVSILEGITNE